ncbi:MAG: PEP-CTERM sorting domain-containing protein [Akkermansia sp.]|nr:PEP-CTERM sorting domain-containing protein [Akkermansia sp.]
MKSFLTPPYNVSIATVPEPTTATLSLLALAALAARRRRK